MRQTIIGIFILASLCSFAQSDSSMVVIKGKLVDAVTKEPVSFAHMFFKKSRSIITSNDSGYFIVEVKKYDSILITSIGYKDFEMSVSAYLGQKDMVIEMKPTAYLLSEVEIRPLPTYQLLKHMIATAEPSEEEIRMNTFYENIKKMKIPRAINMVGLPQPEWPGQQVLFGMNMPLPIGNKKSNPHWIIKKNKDLEKSYKRFNPTVVSRLTGMKDEKEIKKFMRFCQFSTETIIETPEYDFYCMVVKKYKEYKEMLEAERNAC